MTKQGVFLRALASDATEAVIDVVGVIGWEVAYQQLRDMLRAIPDGIKRVVFDIYSPGGDVWEGNGIVQEIGELSKRAETVARIQVAASMATLIAVACQKRSIAANGRFLIHNAWTQTVGDADAHEKAAQSLRDTEAEAAKFYATRTGKTPEEMAALMAEERWLMPEEALALGFVQNISDPFQVAQYEAVRQEIVAAGKWPQALVDIPKQEEKNAGTDTAGTASDAAGVTVEQAEADDGTRAAALAAEYERGKADGIAAGKALALADVGDRNRELTRINAELEQKVADANRLASKYQGEKDKLTAQLSAAQKASDERAQVLRSDLDAVTAKLRQFLGGSLAFSAAVETWTDALGEFGGDVSKAAAKYPQLYAAEKRREGKK